MTACTYWNNLASPAPNNIDASRVQLTHTVVPSQIIIIFSTVPASPANGCALELAMVPSRAQCPAIDLCVPAGEEFRPLTGCVVDVYGVRAER